MGDRGNIAIQDGDKKVWLYTHWLGEAMPSIVQRALQKGKERWSDAPYLARIVFQELIGGDEGLNGFGISAEPQDNEHPFIVINCDQETIYLEDDTRKGYGYAAAAHPLIKLSDYIKLDKHKLWYSLGVEKCA